MAAAMDPRTHRSLTRKHRHLEESAHVVFLPVLEPAEVRQIGENVDPSHSHLMRAYRAELPLPSSW
jgi:hypothetical protein